MIDTLYNSHYTKLVFECEDLILTSQQHNVIVKTKILQMQMLQFHGKENAQIIQCYYAHTSFFQFFFVVFCIIFTKILLVVGTRCLWKNVVALAVPCANVVGLKYVHPSPSEGSAFRSANLLSG